MAKKTLSPFRALELNSGPKILTIAAINESKLKRNVSLVSFRESAKYITLTRKRGESLVEIFGENLQNAVGKRIELYVEHGRYRGVMKPFVAIRSPGEF